MPGPNVIPVPAEHLAVRPVEDSMRRVLPGSQEGPGRCIFLDAPMSWDRRSANRRHRRTKTDDRQNKPNRFMDRLSRHAQYRPCTGKSGSTENLPLEMPFGSEFSKA